MELGCRVLDCKAPAVAVHMSPERLVEAASIRLVAVARTAAVAVHTAVVVQVIGTRRWEGMEKVPACFAADRVGVVLDMASSVAELAPQMRRQQPDVLREACR